MNRHFWRRQPIVTALFGGLFSAALSLSPALRLPAQAQAVPQAKPHRHEQKTAAAPKQQDFGRDLQLNSGSQGASIGKRLGEISEGTPLLAPTQSPFAPAEKTPADQAAPFFGAKSAPSAPAAPPAVTIGAYPLNEALLSKLEKVHAEILNLPDTGDDDDSDEAISGGVDVLVKALEKRPDVMGILGRNLMSAGDYVTATQAAANALSAASSAEEAPVFGESTKISAANLAFGKKYADRIRKLLEE